MDNSELLSNIVTIKWCVIVITVIFIIIGINNIFRNVLHLRPQINEYNEKSFKDEATRLINENKLEEANNLLKEKLKKEPNHGYAHYFLARLQYIERNFDACEITLNKLLDLSPEWKDNHITPLLKRIEEKRNER